MYTLFSDKKEEFKCKVHVEGSSLNETSARLILKSTDKNLMFEGKINSEGMCIIPIHGLRSVIDEGTKGKMVLEVITNGSYFSPWSDEFDVKLSKNVQVEVFSDSDSDSINEMVTVEVQRPSVPKPTPKKKVKRTDSMIVAEELKNYGITVNNILSNKKIFKKVIYNLRESNKLNPISDNNLFLKEVVKHLI